jgi:4-diphosphocytidyl-2-C-methyl-D-erythritol kinase
VKDAAALVDYMRARGNDLESAAMSLRPIIADVKAALARQPGNRIAAMTGSGATCFGIFTDDAAASAAAGALQRAHPQWWVAGTRLG